MNSLVITFDKSKECLYKVSIQENKTSKGQKRLCHADHGCPNTLKILLVFISKKTKI